jgi:hypothetical protein
MITADEEGRSTMVPYSPTVSLTPTRCITECRAFFGEHSWEINPTLVVAQPIILYFLLEGGFLITSQLNNNKSY